MTSILYIGMDVDTISYSVCAYSTENQNIFAETSFTGSADNIEAYLNSVRGGFEHPEEIKFVCGYEAGCLGYSLYRELTARGIECRIMAPSTMASTPQDSRKKNDRLDAQRIAKCLAYGTYKSVYVTDEQDDAVKEYIRMRDDANAELKRVKQQITAFCTRHSQVYDGTKHYCQGGFLDNFSTQHPPSPAMISRTSASSTHEGSYFCDLISAWQRGHSR